MVDTVDMSKTTTTKRIMAGIRVRLNRLLDLESRACGRDSEIAKVSRQREKLEGYVEGEVEKLARKAGEL
jgi:hypothetical protein